MRSGTATKRLTRTLIYFLLIMGVAIWMIPFAAAVLTSFRSNDEIMTYGFLSFPKKLQFTSFIAAWNRGNLKQYLPNSFIITIPSLVMTLYLSSLSAFALSKYRFKGRNILLGVFVGGMMLPFQILLLPVFKLSEALGIYDSYWGLIGIHTAFQLGFCTFVLRNYMVTILIRCLKQHGLTDATTLPYIRRSSCRWSSLRWRLSRLWSSPGYSMTISGH